jgi:hypothetical protein
MLLKTSARAIAIYQLLAAAVISVLAILAFWQGQVPIADFNTTVSLVMVMLNLLAGVELLRGRRRGCWASFVNELFQIPTLAIPGISYDYIALGQGFLGVSMNPQGLPGVSIDPAEVFTYRFDFGFQFMPGTFSLWLGGVPATTTVNIDLISLAFAVVLWRILFPKFTTKEIPDPQQP